MGIIKAKNVVHEFFRRDEEGNVESITTALDHVNLDVKAGQFIAILGHNGSGKSTLAKHINALLTPTEGVIWVDGMDVLDEDNTIPIRKTAGMVFQNPDNQIIARNSVLQLPVLWQWNRNALSLMSRQRCLIRTDAKRLLLPHMI